MFSRLSVLTSRGVSGTSSGAVYKKKMGKTLQLAFKKKSNGKVKFYLCFIPDLMIAVWFLGLAPGLALEMIAWTSFCWVLIELLD